MIIHYKTALIDCTGFSQFHELNAHLMIIFAGDMHIAVYMQSKDNVIKHIRTIADHLRDKKEICYLEDEDE
jgi:hypothetical protein